MRQVGVLAAAGLYALENHFERLQESSGAPGFTAQDSLLSLVSKFLHLSLSQDSRYPGLDMLGS